MLQWPLALWLAWLCVTFWRTSEITFLLLKLASCDNKWLIIMFGNSKYSELKREIKVAGQTQSRCLSATTPLGWRGVVIATLGWKTPRCKLIIFIITNMGQEDFSALMGIAHWISISTFFQLIRCANLFYFYLGNFIFNLVLPAILSHILRIAVFFSVLLWMHCQ